MRLIDANDVKRRGDCYLPDTRKAIANILSHTKTVKDAVVIIRCKDCKYYTSMIPNKNTGICSLASRHLGDYGFCSEGERKENG